MIKIITFIIHETNYATSKAFAYINEKHFVVLRLNDELNVITCMYSEEKKADKPLEKYFEEFCKLPGVKTSKKSNIKYGKSNVGVYYDRIFRYGLNMGDSQLVIRLNNFEGENLIDSFMNVHILLKRLRLIQEVISFSNDNLKTYGYEIRNLFLLACTELENSFNGVLSSNQYKAGNRRTKDFIKLNEPLYLSKYEIEFKIYPNLNKYKPFEEWNFKEPTKSIYWYDSYNKTKHDRETFLNLSTIDNLLTSISACLVMLYAQFGPFNKYWEMEEFNHIRVIPPKFKLQDFYIPWINDELQNQSSWKRNNFQFNK